MTQGKLSKELDKKMADISAKSNYRGGVEYLFLTEPGQYVVRILQKSHDPLEPAFECYDIHRKIYHPDFQNTMSFKCLGRICPICKYAQEYALAYPKDGWRFKKTQAYFYFVVDRRDGKFKILWASYNAQMALVDVIKEMDRQNINVQDFDDGRDILIDVRKSNDRLIYKCYSKTSSETKPVSDNIREELKIVEGVKPLNKLYKDYSISEINKILNQQSIKNNNPQKAKPQSKGSLTEQYNAKMKIKEEKPVSNSGSEQETDALSSIEESSEKKED